MSFDSAFQKVVGVEGRYSNNPKDSGGPTMFGITEVVARANGYKDDMRMMPISVAKQIYRYQYWNILRLDEVNAISEAVAHELFDTGVNLGCAAAAKFLQRSLNALNRQQHDYGDIAVDGVLGPVSIRCLMQFITLRGAPGDVVLQRALNSLQCAFYIDLAERREKDEEFVFGWVLNRVWLK